MSKINKGRKVSVIRDEMGMKGGGIYCFMPFYNLDSDQNAVFKVGMAIDYSSRVEQYHTYFPNGVWMCAFLNLPPVPKKTRGNQNAKENMKSHYLEIEKYIFDSLKILGAKRIHSTTRIRGLNDKNEGQTEWLYTDDSVIHNAFQLAKHKYGGKLLLYNLVNKDVKESEKQALLKPHFEGRLIYTF